MRIPKGFSLLEVMIVVVTLGILAAVVMPQLASASSDATRASIRTQSQTISRQVELYRGSNDGDSPTAHPTDPMGEGMAKQGWGVLVSTAYLKEAPVNAYTGSALLVSGDFATARIGLKTDPEGWAYEIVGSGPLSVFPFGYDADLDQLSHEY